MTQVTPGLAARTSRSATTTTADPAIYCGLDTTQNVVSGTTQAGVQLPVGERRQHGPCQRQRGRDPDHQPDRQARALAAGLRRLQPLPQQLADREQPRAGQPADQRRASPRWRRFSPSTVTRTSWSTRSTGHLMWIADAYVKTSLFPEAYQQSDGTSYMRNAVKAVIDAKTCAITLYAVNMNEPITAAWNAIYPGLLTPLDQMSTYLRSHLRYPEDLFNAQAQAYASVHIHSASVFYQGADLFNIAQENLNGANQATHRVLRRGDASRHEQPAVRAAADIFSGSERGRHVGEQHDGVARRRVRLHRHQRTQARLRPPQQRRQRARSAAVRQQHQHQSADQLGDHPAEPARVDGHARQRHHPAVQQRFLPVHPAAVRHRGRPTAARRSRSCRR